MAQENIEIINLVAMGRLEKFEVEIPQVAHRNIKPCNVHLGLDFNVLLLSSLEVLAT